jgi:hypothetical protein
VSTIGDFEGLGISAATSLRQAVIALKLQPQFELAAVQVIQARVVEQTPIVGIVIRMPGVLRGNLASALQDSGEVIRSGDYGARMT